jgi:hypothetical protein
MRRHSDRPETLVAAWHGNASSGGVRIGHPSLVSPLTMSAAPISAAPMTAAGRPLRAIQPLKCSIRAVGREHVAE